MKNEIVKAKQEIHQLEMENLENEKKLEDYEDRLELITSEINTVYNNFVGYLDEKKEYFESYNRRLQHMKTSINKFFTLLKASLFISSFFIINNLFDIPTTDFLAFFPKEILTGIAAYSATALFSIKINSLKKRKLKKIATNDGNIKELIDQYREYKNKKSDDLVLLLDKKGEYINEMESITKNIAENKEKIKNIKKTSISDKYLEVIANKQQISYEKGPKVISVKLNK